MVESSRSDLGILTSFSHFKRTAHKNPKKKTNDDILNLQVVAEKITKHLRVTSEHIS